MLSGGAEGVQGWSILNGDIEHVVGRVPTSLHIPGKEMHGETLLLQDLMPRWKDLGSRMDYFERQALDLSTV